MNGRWDHPNTILAPLDDDDLPQDDPKYSRAQWFLGVSVIFAVFTVVFWWVYTYAESWWLALAVLTALAILNLTASRR